MPKVFQQKLEGESSECSERPTDHMCKLQVQLSDMPFGVAGSASVQLCYSVVCDL